MASLIDNLQKRLSREDLGARTRLARDWLRRETSTLILPANVRGSSILQDKSRQTTRILPGKLYFYYYDPKTKDKLPYYDRFPLVLPIEKYSDGFLGLNFHYIRPKARILLMDKLYQTATNKNFDETTKLRANYNLLNGASRFEAFKPCLKRYLGSHIKSKIVEIEAQDWEVALLLPVDSFVGGSGPSPGRNKVYRDSGAMYRWLST